MRLGTEFALGLTSGGVLSYAECNALPVRFLRRLTRFATDFLL